MLLGVGVVSAANWFHTAPAGLGDSPDVLEALQTTVPSGPRPMAVATIRFGGESERPSRRDEWRPVQPRCRDIWGTVFKRKRLGWGYYL